MKKFFQIAAFAVVGLIAFTSAKSGSAVYIERNHITLQCNVIVESHDIVPSGSITKFLLEELINGVWTLKEFSTAEEARAFVFNPLIHRCSAPYQLNEE